MDLVCKCTQQFRRQVAKDGKKHDVTENELKHLNQKIDKLLNKLEVCEDEQPFTNDDQCVICVSTKATMQTFPCGHRVVCRKCFIRTIQIAITNRSLPLKCIVCRSAILKLHPPPPLHPSSSSSTRTRRARSTQGTSNPRRSSASVDLELEGTAGIGETSQNIRISRHLHHQQQLQQQQQILPHTGQQQQQQQQQQHTVLSPPHSAPVATSVMQPLLIYPSRTGPTHRRAFLLQQVVPTSEIGTHGNGGGAVSKLPCLACGAPNTAHTLAPTARV